MAVCALVPEGCEQNNKTNEIAEGEGGLGCQMTCNVIGKK